MKRKDDGDLWESKPTVATCHLGLLMIPFVAVFVLARAGVNLIAHHWKPADSAVTRRVRRRPDTGEWMA